MTKTTVTDKEVRGFKPYLNAAGILVRRLAVGGGLYFEVTAKGHRHFIHRFQWQGKGAERAIPGSYPDETSLADARAARDADRLLLRDGKKPGASNEEIAMGADSPTFAEWATSHADSLAAPKGLEGWLRQMTVTTGGFAALRIDEIKANNVKALLLPYWYATPTQAVVICQRVARVLKHRHRNIRPDEPFANPADPALIGDMMGRRRKHITKHHSSLPYEDVPSFMRQLRADPLMSARVAEWAILTGVRIDKEAGEARWGEIDWKRWTWTVPASRMKMEDDKRGEPHVVPLSPAIVRLLRQVRPCRRPPPKSLIFPSSQTGKAYSHHAVWMAVKRINPAVTTHGFRTSLVGWGSAIAHGAHGPFDRELMETCIAHRIGSQTSAAYLRDRWLGRRRIVMKAWSKWCFPPRASNVVPPSTSGSPTGRIRSSPEGAAVGNQPFGEGRAASISPQRRMVLSDIRISVTSGSMQQDRLRTN